MGIHATHGDLCPQVRASPTNWMAGSQAAGLEHEEQPSSSAFVGAVGCTQLLMVLADVSSLRAGRPGDLGNRRPPESLGVWVGRWGEVFKKSYEDTWQMFVWGHGGWLGGDLVGLWLW